MRSLLFGLGLALSSSVASLGFVAGTASPAEACGMYRPRLAESSERAIADAGAAERRGELRGAIRLYERAMNDAKARPDLRIQAALKAGELQGKTGKGRESLRRFEKAVAIDANHYGARMALGRVLIARGDAAAAESQFAVAASSNRATAMDRGNAQAALAIALARQGRAADAQAALEAARGLGALSEAVAEAAPLVQVSTPAQIAVQM